MLKVSFNFDPETNTVSDVTVLTDSSSPTKPKKTVKAKSITPSDTTITLNGASLKLNQDVLDQLKVDQGDRICVRFVDSKVVLARPEVVGETKGGNLITKSLTVSCRGKASEQIAALGDSFTYKLVKDGWMILTGDKITEQDQDQTEDVQVDTEVSNLDESDFTLTIQEGEEIDFVF